MKRIENYETVQASTGDYAKPTAGGYVCKIVDVIDVPLDLKTGKGDYLKIEYDIAEGELKGYYKEAFTKFGSWWASFVRSYKETAIGMFKHFTNCIEASNAGFVWDWNEKELIGKSIGIVIGEEEYEKNDGTVGTRLYVKDVKTVSDIKANNFKVPELKKLLASTTASMPSFPIPTISDDELPFF